MIVQVVFEFRIILLSFSRSDSWLFVSERSIIHTISVSASINLGAGNQSVLGTPIESVFWEDLSRFEFKTQFFVSAARFN